MIIMFSNVDNLISWTEAENSETRVFGGHLGVQWDIVVQLWRSQ